MALNHVERIMRRIWIAAVVALLALPFAACAQDNGQSAGDSSPNFQAGQDYVVVQPPQPTDHPGKVEVMEIFWYGCPHCYDFEPHLENWIANKPDYVAFVRLPAVLNRQWEVHGRAFYTAQALGILDEIHKPLFDAIHKDHRQLFTDEQVAKFFEEHGVDPKTYEATANSFAVQTRLNRARTLPGRYGVTGVPTVIVNGKYRIDARMAKSWDRFLDIIDFLVAKEHQQMESAATNQAAAGNSGG